MKSSKNEVVDYESIVNDVLLHRCENMREAIDEIVSFFGKDKLYSKEFTEHLISKWDISEDDIKEYYLV